ncbi:MAG: FAD-dependent oxidoreductase [Pseudomonadota bacterium]
MSAFPHLFAELDLRGTTLRNRIVSTSHHTYLASDVPNEALIAYHEARARGGAGLIITEIAAIHETALYSDKLLIATTDDCVAPYRRLAEACQARGAKVFAQLFHPGREIKESQDGLHPIAYAPSASPNERFHIMPRPMSRALIEEVVQGYGRAAAYLSEAGLDGVEVVASHGYLPAQFLSPRINRRQDDYGGDFEGRLRFLREVIAAVRAGAGERVVGLRISADELEPGGLDEAEVLAVCRALDGDGALDYFNVTVGSSAALGASVHITPPMGFAAGYTAPHGAALKAQVSRPVLVTGRINQPQVAEQILAAGQADLCGMTRALICDPEMPNKARAGQLDEIRACIACNQSCIGRAHKGFGISCLQYPESGRELEFGEIEPAARAKRVLIAGGGPAGLKAAAVAARRGHQVALYDKARQIGGQALLAQRLPGREEFGGLITNLQQELMATSARVVTGQEVTAALIAQESPDTVILATGAQPHLPEIPGVAEAHQLDAWQVIENPALVGASVVIADWRCDWVGLGLAELLAAHGCRVRLCVNGAQAGELLQLYTRNHYVGRLHSLGVEIRPYLRLYGADADTAYFQDTLSDEAVVLEEMDTLVLALGHQAESTLEQSLTAFDGELRVIGDCLVPRTAEEAVLEGLKVGSEI